MIATTPAPPLLALLLTCEHGGNRVPAELRSLFHGREEFLASHRGYDLGALELARHLARALGAPLLFSTVSRLVVDLNRSATHPRVLSELTRGLPDAERRKIVERHYRPYRQAVEEAVKERVERGEVVIHLSIHSFTPVLEGRLRHADVGLLYDPSRLAERRFAHDLQEALLQLLPDLRARRNYPYLGTSDGLTTHLRKLHAADRYLGIEIEINQRFPAAGGTPWRTLQKGVARALREVLETPSAGSS